jgi:hypothetical protein
MRVIAMVDKFPVALLGFWGVAASTAAAGRAVATPVHASIDPNNANLLVGIFVTGVVLACGQLAKIGLDFYERFRKIDETSEHGRRLAAERRNEEIEKEYKDRIAQLLASGALNTQAYESRIKTLEGEIEFLREANTATREDAIKSKDIISAQSVTIAHLSRQSAASMAEMVSKMPNAQHGEAAATAGQSAEQTPTTVVGVEIHEGDCPPDSRLGGNPGAPKTSDGG